ncbi:bifunctional serine/threonine-protein kinase/ABC transporter substrate-binding protein [Streptomyces profundus]|uniref:bifunctional serine/threonine-protein kinase/ABC transporter substrate-binding protein n=1 Tax=Streptomyces profundus TaxID=2867410 RepID=UPI001D164F17|nr:bifunctional serine/threonine-protein kinase/ABC transporter substrate-binding protein [Streptomyces sp. MA3_2.13]UED87768.1 ABC transporter substrate-binding protein [Streptomyces sp. MA3_2.13]
MRPLRPADPAWVGRYRCLGRLGAGGMGTVLLARGTDGTLVAIKLIRPEFADEPSFRRRFRREVAAARQVTNRWAVPVVAADTEAEAPWLATEFVPGPALDETVAATGALPEPSVRTLGLRLAEALDAVHTAGLVHRDVKPGNVLLAPDGPRLIDFGIARALDDTVLTATDAVIGSPGFLSPEQAAGRPVGPPSDVFSLGCVLAFAASGRRPFGGGPVASVLYRTVHNEPDLGELAGPLRELLSRCLAKDASARPTTGELRNAWHDAGAAAGGWLPGPVTHLIAERSAGMLSLPPIEPTQVPHGAVGSEETTTAARGGTPYPPSGTFGPPHQGPGRTRRRALLALLGGGLGLAGVGGGVLWWNGRSASGTADGADPPELAALTVAFQADLGGPLAEVADGQLRGAEVAVARHNADEQRSFDLVLRAVDDGGSADEAARVAERLASDDAVVAVVAATSPAATRALMDPYTRARKSVVTVTDGSGGNLNSVYTMARPIDALQLRPIVALLTSGAVDGPVVLVDDGSDYSWEITRSARTGLLGGGPEVIPERARGGDAELRDAARRIAGHAPGAVLFGGGWESAAVFAGLLAEAGYGGLCLGTQAMHDPRFAESAGRSADGWLVVSTVTDALAAPSAREFSEAFQEHHGEPPPPFAAEGYDVIDVLARCVEELGTESVDHRDVVEVLRLTVHQGAAKQYAFEEENGLFVGDGVFFYQVADGAFRFLGTEVPDDI